jgi:hypothetical protein
MPSNLETARTTYGRIGLPEPRNYNFLVGLERHVNVVTTVAHAKLWAAELFNVAPDMSPAQVRAFNRVFGTWNMAQNSFVGGFIDGATALHFPNATRGQLAFELGIRIWEPIKIRQRTHGVCGAVVMMQEVCTRDPEAYVEYVLGLATQGRARLNVAGNGLRVRVRANSNIRHTPLPVTPESMAQADYIALVGLRNSENFLPYRSRFTIRMLECGTSDGELVRWMRRAGYTHVRDRTRTRLAGALPTQTVRNAFGDAWIRPHVQRMSNELAQGCVVYLIASGDLGDAALGRIRDVGPGHLMMNVFGAHAMRVLGVLVNPAGVRFRLVTWGREARYNHQVSWSKMTSWYRGYVVGTP